MKFAGNVKLLRRRRRLVVEAQGDLAARADGDTDDLALDVVQRAGGAADVDRAGAARVNEQSPGRLEDIDHIVAAAQGNRRAAANRERRGVLDDDMVGLRGGLHGQLRHVLVANPCPAAALDEIPVYHELMARSRSAVVDREIALRAARPVMLIGPLIRSRLTVAEPTEMKLAPGPEPWTSRPGRRWCRQW